MGFIQDVNTLRGQQLLESVMSELKNDRYLRALLRQPVDVTPCG